MIMVKRRADLKEDGLMIPLKLFINGGVSKCYNADEWMFASQPDELDDSEWNVVLYTNTLPHEVIGMGISIDFDYKDCEEF